MITVAADGWIADVVPKLIREQLPVFADMIIWQRGAWNGGPSPCAY